MKEINEILSSTKHRPFDYPTGDWKYYQEWNDALFLHWKIPIDILSKLVPTKLNIDTFNGNAYISLVAFTMQKIRLKNLPSIKFISDFDEINIRTYINNENKTGVYFLNIEAGKYLSAFIAKKLSDLPYEKSNIYRKNGLYTSSNRLKDFDLNTEFKIGSQLQEKTALDKWLTERYCLYLDKDKTLYRYDIHHKEWALKNVQLTQLDLKYKIGELSLNGTPDLIQYSDGVKVLAWERIKI